MDLFSLLHEHDIAYRRCDHPPVFTCGEANELVPPLPGARTKNLFLRDGKGRRHFLVSLGQEKTVDLKGLASALGLNKPGVLWNNPGPRSGTGIRSENIRSFMCRCCNNCTKSEV